MGWTARGPKAKGQKDNAFRFDTLESAERLQRALEQETGAVSLNERTEKRTPPPLLYDQQTATGQSAIWIYGRSDIVHRSKPV